LFPQVGQYLVMLADIESAAFRSRATICRSSIERSYVCRDRFDQAIEGLLDCNTLTRLLVRRIVPDSEVA